MWHVSVISALRRLRQEDLKVDAILSQKQTKKKSKKSSVKPSVNRHPERKMEQLANH
jgi:hypothetical protein